MYNYTGVLTFLVKFPKHFDHSSEFEIFESNRLVASGFISMLEEECNEPLDNSEAVSESELLPLTAEDIYRDFRLRGFQYAGQFSSMLESDNRCMSGLFMKV
jgi:fatty acid synthase